MPESTQHKLSRVRPPRVQITYDVEIGGAIEKKELPFVVGVLADLSGKPEEALPQLKDRKFVEIDRDNFNEVLAGMKPRLAFQVDNTLPERRQQAQRRAEVQAHGRLRARAGRQAGRAAPQAARGAPAADGPAQQDGRQRQARSTCSRTWSNNTDALKKLQRTRPAAATDRPEGGHHEHEQRRPRRRAASRRRDRHGRGAGLLDQIIAQGRMARDDEQRAWPRT